jgi:hypothetical protein
MERGKRFQVLGTVTGVTGSGCKVQVLLSNNVVELKRKVKPLGSLQSGRVSV